MAACVNKARICSGCCLCADVWQIDYDERQSLKLNDLKDHLPADRQALNNRQKVRRDER